MVVDEVVIVVVVIADVIVIVIVIFIFINQCLCSDRVFYGKSFGVSLGTRQGVFRGNFVFVFVVVLNNGSLVRLTGGEGREGGEVGGGGGGVMEDKAWKEGEGGGERWIEGRMTAGEFLRGSGRSGMWRV